MLDVRDGRPYETTNISITPSTAPFHKSTPAGSVYIGVAIPVREVLEFMITELDPYDLATTSSSISRQQAFRFGSDRMSSYHIQTYGVIITARERSKGRIKALFSIRRTSGHIVRHNSVVSYPYRVVHVR